MNRRVIGALAAALLCSLISGCGESGKATSPEPTPSANITHLDQHEQCVNQTKALRVALGATANSLKTDISLESYAAFVGTSSAAYAQLDRESSGFINSGCQTVVDDLKLALKFTKLFEQIWRSCKGSLGPEICATAKSTAKADGIDLAQTAKTLKVADFDLSQIASDGGQQ